jgi:hypothetical protein
MGKRSTFDRIPRDCYDTPPTAVRSPFVHLAKRFRFLEPCAGRGALLDCLVAAGGQYVGAFDIEPRRRDIGRRYGMTVSLTPSKTAADDYGLARHHKHRGFLLTGAAANKCTYT